MRRSRTTAIIASFAVLAAAGCSSHSAIPSPGSHGGVTPFVVQKGKVPINWTIFTPNTLYTDFYGIIVGPDKNIWYTDYTGMGLDKMKMSGNNKEFRDHVCAVGIAVTGLYVVLTDSCSAGTVIFDTSTHTERGPFGSPSGDYSSYDGAATAKSGLVWFSETKHLASITQAGVVKEYPYTDGATFNSNGGVAFGLDGNIWFTNGSTNNVADIRIGTHTITNHILSQTCAPNGITPGPGNGPDLYFACSGASTIGEITTGGGQKFFPSPIAPRYGAEDITTGPDGQIWFTTSAGVAELNPGTGIVTTHTVPSGYGSPQSIVVGPDGNMWMTENQNFNAGQIEVYIINPMTVVPKFKKLGAVGDQVTLTVTENGVSAWTGSTSNAAVATVAQGSPADSFVVTATGAGNCTIAISDGVGNTFDASITVI